MLFKTHLLLGITLFLLCRSWLSAENNIIFFLFVMLGSILPDIDQQGSKINQWFGILGTVIAKLAKHRGFFHSLLFFALASLLIARYWNLQYAIGLLMGYAAHILGDGVTPMGIQILYPFSRFTIRGPIKVGGVAETLLLVLLVILIFREFI